MNDTNDPARRARAEADAARPTPAEPLGETAGDVIDRYTLIEPIGEGGMGTVWRASQTEPVRREVALKVIKLGMDTREVVVRFEAERQALALMDHPGIAKVIDGGATANGRPYFVMELVQGTPITDFARDHQLGLRERLELFGKVCEAVQHAHHKGVIHRDLKPSNVLVAMGDNGPQPKVIDFGIAKATSAELTNQTVLHEAFTQAGQIIGTPEYMAPEQAGMDGADIDTRADVYSLGVLLYELLTGTKPFDMRVALQAGYEELMRQIREVPPAKPSTRVSGLSAEEATNTAPSRVNVETLSRRLRGDLDWVVMKAIEKDRGRRYDTPTGLADDVARYLRQEPVTAAPPSATYRFKTFVKRRRKTVAAIATIAVLLVGGLAGTAYGLVEANRANADLEVAIDEKQDALERETEQRERAQENEARALEAEAEAQRELARAKASTYLVEQMLASARPQVALGRDTTLLREITDEASRQLVAGEIEDPIVEAEVDELLGFTYISLEDNERAEFHYERAYSTYAELLGEDDEQTLTCRRSLVVSTAVPGRFEETIAAGRELLEDLHTALGPDTYIEASLLSVMGAASRKLGRFDEAEAFLTAGLDVIDALESGFSERDSAREAKVVESSTGRDELLVERSELDLAAVARLGRSLRRSLASLYSDLSRFDEALALIDAVYEEELEAGSSDTPQVLFALGERLTVLGKMGRIGDAVEAARGLVDSYARVLGPNHQRTIGAKSDLATDLRALGRNDEAIELGREVVAWYEANRGPTDPETIFARYGVALSVLENDQPAEAERLFDELLPLVREYGAGDDSGEDLKILNVAAIVKRNAGKFDEAEAISLETIERMKELWGLESRDTLGAITNLGWLYMHMNRPQDALEQFELSLPIKRRVLGETHQFTRAALSGTMAAKLNTGDYLGGREALKELMAVLEARVEEVPNDAAALTEAARIFLMPPMPDMVDLERAVEYGERAVEASQRQDAQALGLLATAYGRAERWREALATADELLGRLEEGSELHRQVTGSRRFYAGRVAKLDEQEAQAAAEDAPSDASDASEAGPDAAGANQDG